MSEIYDLVIIGGGPAALAAGLYASRARLNTVLIESLSVMGQLTMTDMIENYPGVKVMSGFGLVGEMKKQASSFGLINVTGTVNSVSRENEDGKTIFRVNSDEGSYSGRAVIIATGARPKNLNVPGEDTFRGRGVSYCATCDGAFFRGKNVVVVGGGDTAVEEAMFLTKFAAKVTIIHRRNELRAIKIIQERAAANPKISFVLDTVVKEITGGEKVERVVIENVKSKSISEIACDGVFIFTGWSPNTAFLAKTVEMDEAGNIFVDKDMRTSVDGVFAAGDCCARPLKQVVTACADGAVAAFTAGKYIEEIEHKK